MNTRISELIDEIKEREEELEDLVKFYEEKLSYKIEGKKIQFDHFIEDAHLRLKINVIQWLRRSSLRNIISAPFIYPMIIPFIMMDILITLYQFICFTLYRIPKVPRSKYIVVDRHHLKYLNAIEKMNCIYCGYINGLISYMREIVARTEQYWCPIKHARKVLDPHRRYLKFSNFGHADNYHQHVSAMRNEFIDSD